MRTVYFIAATLFVLLPTHRALVSPVGATQPPSTSPANNVLEVMAPKDLQARAAANVPRVHLSWTDNIEGEAGFSIERSADGGKTFTEVARVGRGVIGHIDAPLDAASTYAYRARAFGNGWIAQPTNPVETRTTDFRVFDSTDFASKPDLAALGIERVYLGYAAAFFHPHGKQREPNETMTRATARRAAERGQILIIDIEHWPLDRRIASEQEVQASIDKLTRIVGWIRDEQPAVKLGMYAFLPLRDYGTPHAYWAATTKLNDWWAARTDQYTRQFEAWQAANDRLRPLAGRMDYIFPSLYTFHDDQTSWEAYARGNIDEAKRYGKPVYPFLWMQYHESNKALSGTAVPPDYWRRQLDLVRKHADGVVIWGPGHRWSSKWKWWEVTEEFLAEPGPAK